MYTGGRKNPQLTTDSSAVYHRDEKRSSFLNALLVSMPICLCKPFSFQGCPGILKLRNRYR